MASIFHEFSNTYNKFSQEFPKHPLVEEIRRAMARNRFPRENWLSAQTKKMKDIMSPFWLRVDEATCVDEDNRAL
jgi:hypothetical protein